MSPPSIPVAGPIRILVAGHTDRGRQRSENQDDFLVADLTVPASEGGVFVRGDEGPGGPFRLTVGPRGALLAVTDGMGGAVAGGLASRLASSWIHEELEEAWGRGPDVEPARFAGCLKRAVERANDRLFRQSIENPELREMGTTATVGGILDDVLFLAQVGDSRAYLVRGGVAVQLTRDQSMVQALVEAGTLTEEQAQASTQRNVILQALGPRQEVRVALTRQVLRRGDVIFLCSDGLSGQLRREEIAGLLSATADPVAACAALVEAANERGGPDNITVVVALLDGEGLALPSFDDEVGCIPFDEE